MGFLAKCNDDGDNEDNGDAKDNDNSDNNNSDNSNEDNDNHDGDNDDDGDKRIESLAAMRKKPTILEENDSKQFSLKNLD